MSDWSDMAKIALCLLLVAAVASICMYFLSWSSENSGTGLTAEKTSFQVASNIKWNQYIDAEMTGMNIKSFLSQIGDSDDVIIAVTTKRYQKVAANPNKAGIFNASTSAYDTSSIGGLVYKTVTVSMNSDTMDHGRELYLYENHDGYVSDFKYIDGKPERDKDLGEFNDETSRFFIENTSKYHTDLIYNHQKEVIGIYIKEV